MFSGGGTSGCTLAGRLAEDTNARILIVEAGPHNKELENVHMVGGWSQNFDSETDWNLITPPMQGVKGRQVKLSRGKFLGGSSGVNGTLCIRGSKQDYDDWGSVSGLLQSALALALAIAIAEAQTKSQRLVGR